MERNRGMDSKQRSNLFPNRTLPRKEPHQEQHQKNNNSNERDNIADRGNKKLNTDPLDDAMKELLDICQLYSEKLSLSQTTHTKDCNKVMDSNGQIKSSKVTTNNKITFITTNNNSTNSNDNNVALNGNGKRIMTTNCDNGHSNDTKPREAKQEHEHESSLSKQSIDKSSSDSIVKLQQKQSELQSQLDEVLKAAKSLALRQTRKLSSILEDADEASIPVINGATPHTDDEEDEDEELLEFQQIENELRISELNRQLDVIQEELRIKLYKRLFSNNDSSNTPLSQQLPNQSRTVKCGSQDKISTSPEESTVTTTTEPTSSSSSSDFNNTSSSNCIVTDSKTSASNNASIISQQEHNDSFRSYVSDRRHRTSPPREPIVLSKEQKDAAAAKIAADIEFYAESNNTTIANDEFLMDYKISQQQGTNDAPTNSNSDTPTNHLSDLESIVDSLLGRESALSSSKDQKVIPTEVASSLLDKVTQLSDVLRDIADAGPNSLEASSINPTCSGNNRNNSANSDLERIEEDEEDSPDFYYSSSDQFRSIYEEKLSPMIYGTTPPSKNNEKHSLVDDAAQVFELNDLAGLTSPKPAFQQATQDYYAGAGSHTGSNHSQQTSQIYHQHKTQQHLQHQQAQYNTAVDTGTVSGSYSGVTSELGNNRSFNVAHNGSDRVAGKSNTNRPLTLYLPKPDEEIDLVDHVQALGHDLNIISNHLKLDANCAHGYLWKSCSTNSKKWLKRYFFFDRSKKVLSYYKSEGHLVKKQCSAKNFIRFEEISDVYVDHKLSGIGEKDRSSPSSKKNNFVFVLATIRRKYVLSSSMAQIMRAWIDILFTAAKANDFFQQLAGLEGDKTFEIDGEDPSVYETC